MLAYAHATSSLQAAQPAKHKVLTWTRSRWQNTSRIKHDILKRELWMQDVVLQGNLLQSPAAKVVSTCAAVQLYSCLQHAHQPQTAAYSRCLYLLAPKGATAIEMWCIAAAVARFGAGRYRQLSCRS